MAYAAVVTVKKRVSSGARISWEIEILETDAGPADVAEIVGDFPSDITISHTESHLGAGAGSTINPMLGKAAGFVPDDINHIATNSSTAARINDNTVIRAAGLVDGRLYWRSNVNSGADNTITTLLRIVKGHVI